MHHTVSVTLGAGVQRTSSNIRVVLATFRTHILVECTNQVARRVILTDQKLFSLTPSA